MTETTETPKVPATTEPGLPSWKDIAAAGGMQPWVLSELRRKSLLDEGVDPSRLSKAEKKNFKARREEERRVRAILRKQAWHVYKQNHLVHLGAGIHLFDTPDVDKYDVTDPEARRAQNELADIPDANALAEALGLTLPRMRWLAYHREVDTGTHYHRWHIPKRTGGMRLISSPKPDLKRAQRVIARQITERLPVHGAAHGFIPSRSIATNAAPHADAAIVIKLDLKDFYPTITMPRVKGLIRKAGYGEQVATVIALLCTEAPREELMLRGKKRYVATGPRSLPQGAPTSPSITNALCLRLDSRLAGLARSMGAKYTRYADDLTFSFARKEAPVGKMLGAVKRIVEDEGFIVHPKKTRVMRNGRRQKVTGLIVNGGHDAKARVPRETIRKLRAAVHQRELGKPGKGETLDELKGMAAFIHMTDPEKGAAFMARLNKLG